ncbi:endonuclease/exonuclease/phosphatase family protein [Demequina iriomotensis]|uniref:endonuclease/exonuclease/phosphatase family protein n=1 Tax=Demequina iriomotensis TaxID=1536641 RepID=UPI0007805610|nr:endonuclease/exonuclease/phosphatase family protein [Demequina iriomotensis]
MDDAGRTGRADDAAAGVPWRRLATVGGWVLLAGLLVPVAARLLGWERGPLAYAVTVVPWIAVGALVPAALAVLGRAWRLLAAAGATAVLCAVWAAPLYVAEPGPGEPVLTVASANLLTGRGDAAAVVAMVRERHVDVLSLQELTPEAADALADAGLEELLPYTAAVPDAIWRGTGLWSRYPIEGWESLDGYTFHQVRARLDGPDGALTVLALHPAAPQPWVHRAWSSETAALVEVLDGVDGPVLAAGDLNTTRDHAVFRELESRGFADAADQAGAGLLPTYPVGRAVPPLVVLDHVLERDTGWVASEVATVAIPGSDHRAIVATYARR